MGLRRRTGGATLYLKVGFIIIWGSRNGVILMAATTGFSTTLLVLGDMGPQNYLDLKKLSTNKKKHIAGTAHKASQRFYLLSSTYQ